MSRFKVFLREKGFYFALLGCILLASLASVWAVRTMLERMSKQDSELLQEEAQWGLEDTQQAMGEAEKVPVTTAPPASSASSSGQSGVSEPSALQTEPEPAAEQSAGSAGYYVWPVEGSVSQGYSGDELVYNATLGDWRTHNGIDLACQAGSGVSACAAGRVSAVYEDGLFGTVVEVTGSDGLTWKYCGLAKGPEAAVEQSVAAGQRLGTVGTVESESAAGSHLHLEVLRDGVWQDPEALFD